MMLDRRETGATSICRSPILWRLPLDPPPFGGFKVDCGGWPPLRIEQGSKAPHYRPLNGRDEQQ